MSKSLRYLITISLKRKRKKSFCPMIISLRSLSAITLVSTMRKMGIPIYKKKSMIPTKTMELITH